MRKKIFILDTTLRDGEQSLKKSMTVEQKLKIALCLEEMGVDIIESGFPISSPEDFKAVEKISKVLRNSRVCSLSRCIDKDIDIAVKAMELSEKFRIHLFLGTSELHVRSKLKKSFDEIIDMAIKSIDRAKKYTNDIEFSCEDAGRTSIDNLCKIVQLVIGAGVTTINIPDTVGFTIPSEFGFVISQLKQRVKNIHKAIISVHCHNDLGMAVGNSIAAIESGARQVEGTINGIGERAGNTALEEIIVAIKMKKKVLNIYTDINISKICKASRLVSSICNMYVPSNKAIVGSNAFCHSSGIHQDGVLKNRENYEIIAAEDVGFKNNKLNLTSRSGRAAIKFYMDRLGYKKQEYDLDLLYNKFIKLADIQGQVFDYDLEILSFLNEKENIDLFSLKSFKVSFSSKNKYKITINLLQGKKRLLRESNSGKLLLHVILNTIFSLTNIKIFLKSYCFVVRMKKEKEFKKLKMKLLYKKRVFYGFSCSSNFEQSVLESIINVLNIILKLKKISLIRNKVLI